jgi:hypothetical protein
MLDGAQRTPHGPLDLRKLDGDFYAFSGHKSYGPTGIQPISGRRKRETAVVIAAAKIKTPLIGFRRDRRGDLFEKRRRLMAAWATYCLAGSTAAGSIVSIERSKAS